MGSNNYAYLAGIIDGEGWISLWKDKRGGRIRGELGIGNTNKELMDWIHTNFGGSVYSDIGYFERLVEGVVDKVLGKRRYKVIWRGEESSKLLPHLLPFLIVKYNKARCFLDLCSASDYAHTNGNDRDSQELAYAAWLVS